MKYAIVFSSRTGNTAVLADTLRAMLSQDSLVCYGGPDEQIKEADLIFTGFWTDKGDCNGEIRAFLESLHNQKVFLFGTAGFGGSEDYFSGILSRVQAHLDASCTVTGTYMCQGKMPAAVRKRYETMLLKEPEKMQKMIDNFDRAASHPDSGDLQRLEAQAGMQTKR